MAPFNENFTEEMHSLTEQLKVVVNAVDELTLVLDHLSRNRHDIRYSVYQAAEAKESSESVAETVTCYTCDARAESLAEAVQNGWRDLQKDDGMSWEYLAACPDCQKAEQEETAIEQPKPAAVPKAKPRELF